MSEVLKAYKFRIYPNLDQQTKLNKTFGCARFVWNALTANFNAYGGEHYVEKLTTTHLKEKFEFLGEVSAAALQQKSMDFNATKEQFFNKNRKSKIGIMKFKKKNVSRESYRLPNQKFKLDQDNQTIRLEKIGSVPVVLDRTIPEDADYRSVTVSKTPSGKYFVSVLVKINVTLAPLTGKSVGIDLGLKDLFILSNGDVINNPRWFRESQSKLARAQRHLSRKTKGSNRYNKQRVKVARLHEKVVNQRNHFLHCVSTTLVREFDVIVTEDLNVQGLKKCLNLGKSISDAGWSSFVSMLKYKCEWYGKTFSKIDRFYPSSQICSSCGQQDGKKTLEVREWVCSSCGKHHDRDFNAATNILVKGYADLTGLSIKESSAELVDYRRGEDVRLGERLDPRLATFVKCLQLNSEL